MSETTLTRGIGRSKLDVGIGSVAFARWLLVGIHLPFTRRASIRGPDRRPVATMLMVSVDREDVIFT
jgi:hypothetical protein